MSDRTAVAPELRTLLDASPDPVLVVDRSGRIVALNQPVETLFGTTAERLLGSPIEILVPVRARAAHATARAAYTEAATVRRMSDRQGLTGLRADGTEFPLEVALTPIAGSEQGLVMAVVHDVSARHRLEGSVDRTRRALDAIPDAVLTTDAEGRVDFLNRSAEALTGLTRQSARGRPLAEVLPLTDEQTGAPCPAAAILHDRRPDRAFEGVLPPSAGRDTRVLDVSATAIRDAAGSVTGATVVARDVTHARLIAQQLSHQATHDALTGLVNRAEFERRLTRAVTSAARGRSEHALCFLDLDGFKRVNDACGHMAGDELLRQLSEIMRDRMRSRDTLGRLGGDEFGLLLEHCRLGRAERIADDIRRAIGLHRFCFGAETYAVAASIGVVPIRREAGRATDVLREADTACYLAKRGGGNQLHVSRPRGEVRAPADGKRARDVVLAIRQHKFELYAQPLLPLDGGGVTAPDCEILLRLKSGAGDARNARAFLPAARRHGLMAALDIWVTREVLGRLSAWRAAHPDTPWPTVAINLDEATVTGGHLLPALRETLAETSVPPRSLCFEIDESVAAAHAGTATRLLRDLRAAGVT